MVELDVRSVLTSIRGRPRVLRGECDRGKSRFLQIEADECLDATPQPI